MPPSYPLPHGSHGPGPSKRPLNLARAWAEMRALMWTHRRALAIGFSLMLVSRLAGFVLPTTSKYLIDDVIKQGRTGLLVPLALAAGGATLVQAITSFGLSQVVGVAAQRAIADMRIAVERHVIRLPVSYFDSTRTGVLISRIMTDAEGIRNLVGTGIVQLVGGSMTATIALAILFYLNWRLTAVMIVVLVGFGTMMAFAFKRLRPIFRERSVINAEVTGRLSETLAGVRIVKVYTAEEREGGAFAEGVERLFANVRRTITGTSAVGSVTTAIVGGVGVLLMLVGGRAILAGTMTLGDFVMYSFVMGMLSQPLVQIASIGTQVSEAFAGLDRIREIRDMETEETRDAARAGVPDVRGDIEFEDVCFEYVEGLPVLHDVSFRAPAGSTTALVGSSGAGKSTLIGLVMAFYHPTSGRILVDGCPLEQLRLHEYRGHLGAVMQENFLFDGTIRENIAFGRPGASQEEIEAVARVAHVDEFVDQWEERYDTVVGERGVKLSGGQRQRVAIARAILADPRVLILDEATSSLDSESEAMIRDGLRRLRAGRTTFVIAHRLSTIESADQILVIEAGRILERGTHEELLSLGGRYRELHDRQYGIESDRFINPGEDFTPENSSVEGEVAPRT